MNHYDTTILKLLVSNFTYIQWSCKQVIVSKISLLTLTHLLLYNAIVSLIDSIYMQYESYIVRISLLYFTLAKK